MLSNKMRNQTYDLDVLLNNIPTDSTLWTEIQKLSGWKCHVKHLCIFPWWAWYTKMFLILSTIDQQQLLFPTISNQRASIRTINH